MAAEIPGVRPAVISGHLKAQLDRYRAFRHVVRNVYAFSLDRDQVERLVVVLPDTLSATTDELTRFADLLESLANG